MFEAATGRCSCMSYCLRGYDQLSRPAGPYSGKVDKSSEGGVTEHLGRRVLFGLLVGSECAPRWDHCLLLVYFRYMFDIY